MKQILLKIKVNTQKVSLSNYFTALYYSLFQDYLRLMQPYSRNTIGWWVRTEFWVQNCTTLPSSALSDTTGSLRSATVEVFTPWKSANVTNQASPPNDQSLLLNIYQHPTAYNNKKNYRKSGPKVDTLATYYTSIYMCTDESGSWKKWETGKLKIKIKNLNMILKQTEKHLYVYSV